MWYSSIEKYIKLSSIYCEFSNLASPMIRDPGLNRVKLWKGQHATSSEKLFLLKDHFQILTKDIFKRPFSNFDRGHFFWSPFIYIDKWYRKSRHTWTWDYCFSQLWISREFHRCVFHLSHWDCWMHPEKFHTWHVWEAGNLKWRNLAF